MTGVETSEQPPSAEQLQKAFSDAVAAFAAALQPVWQAAVTALRMVAQDPVVKFAIENPDVMRAMAQRPQPEACHCFCGKTHPDRLGVCDMMAAGERRYLTERLGEVRVPLCAPCATAQGIPVST